MSERNRITAIPRATNVDEIFADDNRKGRPGTVHHGSILQLRICQGFFQVLESNKNGRHPILLVLTYRLLREGLAC
jgi:hypothetical protein